MAAKFIALPLPPPTPTAASVSAVRAIIHLELRRGPMVVNVTWPLAAASQSAAWLREGLR